MTKTRKVVVSAAVLAIAFAAGCSRLEEANNGKGYAGKADTPAYASGGGQYSAGGFDAGNKTSWSDALKVRATGQNEYNRTPAREN